MSGTPQTFNPWPRRLMAGGALLAALLMMILGLTTVEPKLSGISFFVWWGIVLMLVLFAGALAALDLIDLQHDLREGRRALWKEHLGDKRFLRELQTKVRASQSKSAQDDHASDDQQ